MPEQKSCFVVMGFGEKTDYQTQRTLVFQSSEVDSPVYTFLPDLGEPVFRDGTAPADAAAPPPPADGNKIVFGALLEEALPRDADGRPDNPEDAYRVAATRLEALLGLGEKDRVATESAALFRKAPADWMPDSARTQLQSLEKLL